MRARVSSCITNVSGVVGNTVSYRASHRVLKLRLSSRPQFSCSRRLSASYEVVRHGKQGSTVPREPKVWPGIRS